MVRLCWNGLGIAFLLGAAAGLLVGCAGMRPWNAAVDPERRIPIPESGVAEGVVDAGSALVRYRVAAAPVSGGERPSLDVTARPDSLFYRVDAVRVEMAFLDAEGRPIDSHSVFATGFKTGSIVVDGRTLDVPPDAVSLSFSVSAQASSGHR